MADPNWKAPDHLIDELAKEPFAFNFYRAVRLLENARRDLPRVGCSLSPARQRSRAPPLVGDVLQFVGSQPERKEVILEQTALKVGIIAPAARKFTWRFSREELDRHEKVATNG